MLSFEIEAGEDTAIMLDQHIIVASKNTQFIQK